MSDNVIAVDWGSSQLRAWQGDKTLALPLGISRLNGLSPREVFEQHIAPWRESAATPVLMAGMIGSDAGWQPVPYLPCPVPLRALAARLCEVADNVWIVPGLRAGREEVMRGEETQLLGATQLAPAGCYVMPGTHSKWVQVEDGGVTGFSTAMTGELHHLLMTHSLIGNGLPAQVEDNARFCQGLERGLAAPSLVSELFRHRAARVLGGLPAASVGEALSGVLIGAEVRAMLTARPLHTITLVGSAALCCRYQQAFACAGVDTRSLCGDRAFLQGIRSLLDARC
ncbi:2-dehydro-3-deoxygalactonokinase [Chimaeribacter arupi]|uniref:2-dehydro-3-deoxygalactonokinase n=1 Tax=Chimaeribacter arupi TaxID=2060066 RepID=UPI0029451103|nr:2-dehydro-3-deoxygalactonokinase [Chimaeribacter arupi]MDV5140417.1 2-dehydro-3-deoxygalactonokinase [Chimaeribacter arupi]